MSELYIYYELLPDSQFTYWVHENPQETVILWSGYKPHCMIVKGKNLTVYLDGNGLNYRQAVKLATNIVKEKYPQFIGE